MRKLTTTVIGMSIHAEGESPIFSETATHVMVADDSAGPFIVLRQFHQITPMELRFDLDELEDVLVAARRIMRDQPKTED
jgi:hypothetical protein